MIRQIQKTTILYFFLFFTFAGSVLGQRCEIFVTQSGLGDGSTFENATDIHSALEDAQPGQVICVACGIYSPGDQNEDTFRLPEGVTIMGGFSGKESGKNIKPNWRVENYHEIHPTIFDGDYDDDSDSSFDDGTANYSVITIAEKDVVLDGIIVTGGNETRSIDTLSSDGVGGGLKIDGGFEGDLNTVILNSIFRDNTSLNFGASIGAVNSGFTLINVLVTDSGGLTEANEPIAAVSGFSNALSPNQQYSIYFENVTIAGNTGAAFIDYDELAEITLIAENSIFYNNGLDLPSTIATIQDDQATLTNVIFEQANQFCDSSATCNNVIDTDPILRTSDGYYSLTPGSIALNFGDKMLLPEGVIRDAADRPRIQGGEVDAGAFEGTRAITPKKKKGAQPEPEIAIAPTSIKFEDAKLDSVSTEIITIRNFGESNLEILSLSILGKGAGLYSTDFSGPISLTPGGIYKVKVFFQPVRPGISRARLAVSSNDPEFPLLKISMTGETGRKQVPDILLEPALETVAQVLPGESTHFDFFITNQGAIPLRVKTLKINGSDASTFSIIANDAPFVLKKGESREVSVQTVPTTEGIYQASFVVESNDPDEPAIEVALKLFVTDIEGPYCTLFVTPSSSGSGNSFAASTDLQTALGIATPGDVICVASGRYTPGSSNSDSFLLPEDITLIGGFEGTETGIVGPGVRLLNFHVINPTVLDGDYDDSSTQSHSDQTASYNVVTFNSTSVLDGFIITGGNDERSLSTVTPNGFGGGILIDGKVGSMINPVIRNSILKDNAAAGGGAAVAGVNAGYTLVNVLITGNGGGSRPSDVTSAVAARTNMLASSSSTDEYHVKFINVTIVDNCGQAYVDDEAGPGIKIRLSADNSILYNNAIDLPAGTVAFNDLDAHFRNTVFDQRSLFCTSNGIRCENVVDTDPQLRQIDGFFTLNPGSVALDFGDKQFLPPGLKVDGAGRPRIQGPGVDAGAFEGTEPVGNLASEPNIAFTPAGGLNLGVIHDTAGKVTGTFEILNLGSRTLTLTSISGEGDNGFEINEAPVSGTRVPAGNIEQITLSYTPTQNVFGTKSLTITVESDDPDEPVVEYLVTVRISNTSVIAAIPRPLPASLGDDPNIPTVDNGDYFMVEIKVGTSGNPVSDFFGVGGELNWDPSVVELVTLDEFDVADNDPAINPAAASNPIGSYDLQSEELERGTFMAAGDFISEDNTMNVLVFEEVSEISNGKLFFTSVRQAPAPNINGTGSVARIAFRVLDDVIALGSGASLSINFTLSDVQATSAGASFLALTLDDAAGELLIIDRAEVWPGDTDDNGEVVIVNPSDIFPIAQCFQVATNARAAVEIDWAGKDALPSAFPGGGDPCTDQVTPNPIFADANGSGDIDQNDVLAIGVNLGQMQPSYATAMMSAEGEEATVEVAADSVVVAEQLQSAVETITLDVSAEGTVLVDVVVREDFLDRSAYGDWLMGFEGSFDLNNVPEAATASIKHDAAYFEQATLVLPALTQRAEAQFDFSFSATRDASKADQGWGGVSVVEGVVAKLFISGLEAGSQVTIGLQSLSVAPNGAAPVSIAEGSFGLALGTTSVAVEEPADETPSTFELGQNYPNPFNPQTTITYALAEQVEVRLAVFDMLGRQVATLLDGVQQAAGRYEVQFDARDLPSGTYFYQIAAGSFVQTGKMQLIK